MTFDFVGELANQVQSQFSLGENTTNTLDTVVDGRVTKYGMLGDFASKINQSAERKYLEEGYLRKDAANLDTKQFEILMQEPIATILVKKRMFSSLGQNYRPEFMDQDEKIYYKTVKVLLQNKCTQISNFEKLSKIQKISAMTGKIDEQLMPLLFTISDSIGNTSSVNQESQNIASGGTTSFANSVGSFQDVMGRLRRIYGFNQPAALTTWITDSTNLYRSQYGEGTGVIEVTNFSSLNTNIGLRGGSGGFSIPDPYNMMVVTEYDIEKALSDATNLFNNHKTFEFGKESVTQLINSLQNRFNNLRSQRNASPISFKINPDTLLSKKVTAIIERIGTELPFTYQPLSEGALTFGLTPDSNSGVIISPPYLEGGEIAGYDGLATTVAIARNGYGQVIDRPAELADTELSLFQQLVSAIFQKISLEANSLNSLQQANEATNEARKKLRFNFLGKCIIQPMDTIHIYVNSKSKYDNKLLAGLKSMFTGLSFIQSIGGAFTDIKEQVALFNPKEISSQIERAAFVGADFPHFLWALVRPQFVTEREGTHVFAGVVTTATSSFNSSTYTVSVSAQDNFYYFDQGKVNFNPSVDTWNGVFFDPLTPFKTKFGAVSTNFKDESPEPLPENRFILSKRAESGPLLKFKAGPNAGRFVTQDNYLQDRSVDPVTKQFTRTFYAPDGLVYKWKEGIGVFTQFGSSFDLDSPNNVGIPSLASNPLAGQDVMNAISLLITGTPYNYSTYYKAITEFEGFGRDPQSQQDPAASFYTSFQNDLTKRNLLWGNFIPFKSLNVNEREFRAAYYSYNRIVGNNQLLERKLQQLNQLNSSLLLNNTSAVLNQATAITLGFKSDDANNAEQASQVLNGEIQKLLKQIKDDSTQYKGIVEVGDDISFDADEFLYKEDEKTFLPKTRRFLRRQINFLTRRMSYSVRSNEDKNLFIVDDSYDKDYDFAAFSSELASGMQLYNNNFTSVSDKIRGVANILNLEVFCDSQGHVRARTPQYNKMPSSVFYKMMYQKSALKIQVFPQFLDDLFNDQLNTLKERVEVLEDFIRLDCAVLGKLNDLDAQAFVNKDASTGQNFLFTFVSNNQGYIADINQLLSQTYPDKQIETQANAKNIFTSAQRYSFLTQVITQFNNTEPGQVSQFGVDLRSPVEFKKGTYISEIVDRIEIKTGMKVKPSTFNTTVDSNGVFSGTSTDANPNAQVIDVFKVVNDLSRKLSERQRAVKLFFSALKNAQEFKKLDTDPDLVNNMLVPGTYGNENIPEVFEHMIEDETYDDYGPGSGQRYVIKNAQIISYNINENPPDFVSVQVNGVLNKFNPSALPQGLNVFPEGGNGLVTARAIDYDLWRNYGFKSVSNVNVPFITDPETQCAPYAVSLLSRARNNILRGTISLAGNEYYQVGDVVFIEEKNLLFYVENVSHNFNFGGSFTTSLTLSYGHSPGEYIPTPTDIFGKLIYNNKDMGSIQVQRQNSNFNEANYGAIVFDSTVQQNVLTGANGTLSSFGGPTYTPNNATVINNIIYNSSYLIYTQNAKNINVKSKLELRIYYDSKNSDSIDGKLNNFAEQVKQVLAGGVVINDTQAKNSNNVKPITIPKESIEIVKVDVSSDTDHRSPSTKAMDMARSMFKSISLKETEDKKNKTKDNNKTKQGETKYDQDYNKLRKALFTCVIDCWIKLDVFQPEPQVVPTETNTGTAAVPSPQQTTNDLPPGVPPVPTST